MLPPIAAPRQADGGEFLPVEEDASVLDLSVSGQKAQAGEHADTLARTALTHQAEDFPPVHMEAHIPQGMDSALCRVKGHRQMPDIQEAFVHALLPLGFSAVSSPSPMKFREKITMQITSTGQTICMG